jgi:hypothetical protein
MPALGDFGRGIQLAELLLQLFGPGAVALGDEDESGAADITHRLAQDAARRTRRLPNGLVRSTNTMSIRWRRAQVLEAVVEDQRVAPELAGGIAAGLDAILIHTTAT